MKNLWTLWILHFLTVPVKFVLVLILKMFGLPWIFSQDDYVDSLKLTAKTLREKPLIGDSKLVINSLTVVALLDVIHNESTDKYWIQLMRKLPSIPLTDIEDLSALHLACITRLKNKNMPKTDRVILINFFGSLYCTGGSIRLPRKTSSHRVFSWYSISKLPTLLLWFETWYQLTGNVKFRLWYKRFRFISVPLLLLGCNSRYKGSLFLQPEVYGHRYLGLLAGWLSTSDWVFCAGLTSLTPICASNSTIIKLLGVIYLGDALPPRHDYVV